MGTNSLECIDTAQLIRSFSTGSVFLFTGAGLSVECGIPLWYQLRDKMLRELFTHRSLRVCYDEFILTYQAFCKDAGFPLDSHTDVPPEAVVLVYRAFTSELQLLTFLQENLTKKPCGPYLWLGELIHKGILSSCATVNVDKCLEIILATLQWLHPEFKFVEVSAGSITISSAFTFLKLHGTYDRVESLCIEPQRLTILEEWKQDALGRLLSDHQLLLFYGYAGNDQDIANFFERQLERKSLPNLRQVIFVHKDTASWTERLDLPHVARVFEKYQRSEGYSVAESSLGNLTSEEVFAQAASHMGIRNPSAFLWKGTALVGMPVKFQTREEKKVTSSSVRKMVTWQQHLEDCEYVVSSPSCFMLFGSYGVYESGRMITMVLPLRVYCGAHVLTGARITASVEWCESVRDIFGAGYLDDVSNSICSSMIDAARFALFLPKKEIADIGFPVIDKNIGLHFKVYSEVPPGGLEENIRSLLATVLYVCTKITGREAVLDLNTVLLLSALLEFRRRPTASYLSLLPAFGNVLWPTAILYGLERSMPRFNDWSELAENNHPWQIHLADSLFSSSHLLSEDLENEVDFGLCIYPRCPVAGRSTPDTRASVESLSVNVKPYFRAISNLTDQARSQLFCPGQRSVNWPEIGRMVVAHHYLLNCLERADARSNRLVDKLAQSEGVYGAGGGGAGPGGPILALCSPHIDWTAFSNTCWQEGAVPFLARIASSIESNKIQGITVHKPYDVSWSW